MGGLSVSRSRFIAFTPTARKNSSADYVCEGFPSAALKDIVAVSEESYVFHYLNTLAPMSMPGTGYVAPTSVVAPALLLEDVELERPQEDLPKLPVVPPPPLTAAR